MMHGGKCHCTLLPPVPPPPNPTYKLYCPLDGAVPPSTVLPHTTPAILTNVEPPVLLASDAARLLPPAMVVRKETWCVSKLVDQMVVQVVVTIRRWFLRWSRRWLLRGPLVRK